MAFIEASHMLGDFLVRNRAITAADLSRALELQKRVAAKLGLLSLAQGLLSEDERLLLDTRLQMNPEETLEEALAGLELLSTAELAERRPLNSEYRIPLGNVLQQLGIIDRRSFKQWLLRFERQKFDRSKLKQQLKKISIFAALPPAALSRLCNELTYKYFTAGDYVYRAGEKSNGIYVIESGLVRMLVEMKGETRITGSAQNGDIFGIPGVLTASIREENALAITDTVVWRLTSTHFLRLIKDYPGFAERTARQIGGLYQSSIHNLRYKTRINESKLFAVYLAPGADEHDELANTLFESLSANLPPNSLIINALPDFSPTGMRQIKRSTSLARASVKPVKPRKDIFYTQVHGIEDHEIVDNASVEWLRRATGRCAAIVLLVLPGTRGFRRFVMGLSRRTATLVRHEFPGYLNFLKPGRDRIYQLSTGSVENDRRNRGDLQRDCPGTLIPNLITRDKEKTTAERIARWIAGKSVGIAFGGGGARALSHLGVLDILEKTGLVIDMISGASAGAHVGGMLATGKTLPWMHEYFQKHAIARKGHPFNDYTFPFVAFIRGNKYRNLLKTAFGNSTIADVEIPFFPVATDLKTGLPVTLTSGDMAESILASGSVPGVFPPIVRREGVLADGGMLNNIPANILKDWDTSFVIGINTSIDPSNTPFKPRSIGKIMLQTLDIFMLQSVKSHEEHTDFDIKPDVDAFSVTDHNRGREIIEEGRRATRRVLPQLLRALKKAGIQ
ncbi:MAG: patatin-like phospholipase family protein [Leptospirales bacterium]|nr:patatin-like phospholipase family protein [Leptospirales bacterium]